MSPADVKCKKYSHMELEEMKQDFLQHCGAGDLEWITAFVKDKRLSERSLTDGLSAAVQHRKHNVANFLLNKGAVISPGIVVDANIFDKSVEVFQLLLDHGWNINEPVNQGLPALLDVVEDERLVRWFFDHGAELDHSMPFPPDKDYCRDLDATCLYLNIAACTSTTAVFDLFLAHGAARADSIPLHTAASVPDREERIIPMMIHLIDLGFDINGTDDHTKKHPCWGTPLVYAVRSNAVGNVKFLLSKGADPLKPENLTPLELAKRMEFPEIVAILENWKPS